MTKGSGLFSLLVLFVVFGCAAVGHLNTPSGQPEITVHAPVAVAQNVALGWLLSNGYKVGQQVDTKAVSLSGGKDVTSAYYRLFPGNQDIQRVLFNFFAKDSTTTVIYATRSVTSTRTQAGRGGTTGEYTELRSQEDLDSTQSALNVIAASIPK